MSANKRRYVHSARQTRPHICHWPNCDQQVPPATWGCRPHWFRLPKEIRDEIWRTYRPGQEYDGKISASYLEVALTAQTWIADYLSRRVKR